MTIKNCTADARKEYGYTLLDHAPLTGEGSDPIFSFFLHQYTLNSMRQRIILIAAPPKPLTASRRLLITAAILAFGLLPSFLYTPDTADWRPYHLTAEEISAADWLDVKEPLRLNAGHPQKRLAALISAGFSTRHFHNQKCRHVPYPAVKILHLHDTGGGCLLKIFSLWYCPRCGSEAKVSLAECCFRSSCPHLK